MKIFLIKISFLIILVLLINCAATGDSSQQNTEIDGIVYFKKDEPGIKKKSPKKAKREKANNNKNNKLAKAENLRDFKKNDGIIYFGIEDQINESPDRPLELIHYTEQGKASFYGDEFDGRRTANGEIFDQKKMTAAHPTLKFGTKVRVINLFNEKSVVVRINDRGPFVKNRIIDLSKAAAEKLGMIKAGVAEVFVEVVGEQ